MTWEDGIFLAEIAPRARRISVLRDKGYYVKQRRADRRSASFRAHAKAAAALQMVAILRPPQRGCGETDIIAFRLYHRLLRSWNTRHFLRLAPNKRDLLVCVMREAAVALIPASRDAELPNRLQLRSLAFRTGRTAVVGALVQSEQDDRRGARARRPVLLPILIRAGGGRLRLRVARAARRLRRHSDPSSEPTPTPPEPEGTRSIAGIRLPR